MDYICRIMKNPNSETLYHVEDNWGNYLKIKVVHLPRRKLQKVSILANSLTSVFNYI